MARKRALNDPSIRVELTGRQREVLAMIERGATNGEIAEHLGLSLEGAKWHVREIFGRLGVDSREEAVERWREARPRAWAPLAATLFGVSAAAAVAVVVVSIIVVRSSGTVSTGAPEAVASEDAGPTALQIEVNEAVPQPALREVAAGDGWRLLLADDGLGMPPAAERLLAVGYDQEPPRVDVLGKDGRIAARVEGGYALMARLNPGNGDLVVSDWVGPPAGAEQCASARIRSGFGEIEGGDTVRSAASQLHGARERDLHQPRWCVVVLDRTQ